MSAYRIAVDEIAPAPDFEALNELVVRAFAIPAARISPPPHRCLYHRYFAEFGLRPLSEAIQFSAPGSIA